MLTRSAMSGQLANERRQVGIIALRRILAAMGSLRVQGCLKLWLERCADDNKLLAIEMRGAIDAQSRAKARDAATKTLGHIMERMVHREMSFQIHVWLLNAVRETCRWQGAIRSLKNSLRQVT